MSQEKAQLIAPLGHFTVPGLNVSGVVTATSFSGNCTGTASSIAQGTNVVVGVMTASSFAGDVFGNAAGLSTTTAGLKLGIVTATSFAGNFTGIGSGLTGTPNIVAGLVTATQFVGNTPGLAAGISGGKNLNAGIITSTSFSGNLTGNATGLSTTTAHVNLGIVTATSFHGSGANLEGVSSGPVAQQAVTANGATTTIDLSNGNLIYMTQSANTTVAFANTEGNTDVVYLIRVKDDNTTTRTITWPSGMVWDGGTEPTLLQNAGGASKQGQTFKLTTRDNGATWYGNEIVNYDTIIGYELWGWGKNEYGELGQNSKTAYSSPVQVPGTDWALLPRSGFGKNLAVIKSNKTLWGVGRGTGGGFGQVTSSGLNYSSPVQMTGGSTGWAQVSVGAEKSTIAVKSDGTLWAWGNNQSGQLANGVASHVAHSSPTQIPGTTWGTSSDAFGGKKYGIHIIKTDGTLWSWGENGTGIIGNNTSDNKYSSPVQIPGTTWAKTNRGGDSFTGAIKTDGTLWMWGSNGKGQIGNNTNNPGGWGSHGYSSPVQIPGTNWRSLTAVYQTALATKTDGTLWAWGSNAYGQLGDNSHTQRSSPVQVGSGTDWTDKHSMAQDRSYVIKTDGTLWSWGRNYAGQLGYNNTTQYSSPVQIPGTNWIDVWGASATSTHALRSS